MGSELAFCDIVVLRKGSDLWIDEMDPVKLRKAQQAIVLSANENRVRVVTKISGKTDNPLIVATISNSDTLKLNTKPIGPDFYITLRETSIYSNLELEGKPIWGTQSAQIVTVDNTGALGFKVSFYTFDGEFISGFADSNDFWPIDLEAIEVK